MLIASETSKIADVKYRDFPSSIAYMLTKLINSPNSNLNIVGVNKSELWPSLLKYSKSIPGIVNPIYIEATKNVVRKKKLISLVTPYCYFAKGLDKTQNLIALISPYSSIPQSTHTWINYHVEFPSEESALPNLVNACSLLISHLLATRIQEKSIDTTSEDKLLLIVNACLLPITSNLKDKEITKELMKRLKIKEVISTALSNINIVSNENEY